MTTPHDHHRPPRLRRRSTRSYDLVGGTATLRFSPSGVTVVVATPGAGFTVDIGESHGGGARVEFESDDHRSRLDGWWDGGPRTRCARTTDVRRLHLALRLRGGRLSGPVGRVGLRTTPPERTSRMPDAPTPNRTRLAAAAGLLGASAVAALVLGAGPAPSVLQLAGASDDIADDISGNCDEAEHADDPECAGTRSPTTTLHQHAPTTTATSTTVDDRHRRPPAAAATPPTTSARSTPPAPAP